MRQNFRMIDELNDALSGKATERRGAMLLRMADLFAFGSGGFSNDQIRMFDDVFTTLVANIEIAARAALAQRLALIPNAPQTVSQMLAFDDNIGVAGAMLEKSAQLTSEWLADAAMTKSQDHLLAISKRETLDESVTDVLIERGIRPVVLSTARNPGARISEAGYVKLISRSDGDDEMAFSVGLRGDVPRHHLLRLMAKASQAVRAKLAAANPALSTLVQETVADVASQFQTRTGAMSRSYQAAQELIEELRTTGRLAESDIANFAKAGQFEETTASLAALCHLPIETVERAMVQDRPETVLIIAKAIGLSWPTVKLILRLRGGEQGVSPHQLEQCLGTFSRLKSVTARQVVDFQRKRAVGG